MQPLKNDIRSSVLAIDGGVPVNQQLFKPWPYYEEDEMAAVRSCMLSGKVNYWTGDECRKFEAEYADYVGVKHAIALPIAHELDATSLCFLVHPTLDSSDMEKTLLAVHKVMAEAALLK